MPGNLIHHPPRDTRLQRSQPPPHSSPQTAHSCPISDPPHANWWERPRESNELEGDQAAGPALGVRLGSPAPRLPEACLWPIKESLMKHGEGITLTLTGRCPALCRGTINNMAASHELAWERGVPSGSSVLTAVFGEGFFSTLSSSALFPPFFWEEVL